MQPETLARLFERFRSRSQEGVHVDRVPEQVRRLRRDQVERELASRGGELERAVAPHACEAAADLTGAVQEDDALGDIFVRSRYLTLEADVSSPISVAFQ